MLRAGRGAGVRAGSSSPAYPRIDRRETFNFSTHEGNLFFMPIATFASYRDRDPILLKASSNRCRTD